MNCFLYGDHGEPKSCRYSTKCAPLSPKRFKMSPKCNTSRLIAVICVLVMNALIALKAVYISPKKAGNDVLCGCTSRKAIFTESTSFSPEIRISFFLHGNI
ncbi:hypothetical protein CDAR_209141 [Caerostris darwini]|uniref:Uncharacterized protein n=1 Tax=Caerostris darwini TaxID=1538125 RepID=A0AAV4VGF8_9ARAC|nr:hypothetical protein CDAR_209141 [Caerostris darwini]